MTAKTCLNDDKGNEVISASWSYDVSRKDHIA